MKQRKKGKTSGTEGGKMKSKDICSGSGEFEIVGL